MKYSFTFEDAVNLAISMHREEDYRNIDLDKLTKEIWEEMQAEYVCEEE